MNRIISNIVGSLMTMFLVFIFFFLSQNLNANDISTQTIGDLQLQMSSETTTATLFENIVYKIAVKNIGVEAKSNVIVNAEIPLGTVFSSTETTSGHYDQRLNKWFVNPIEDGTTVELILTVTVVESDIEIINFSWFDFSTNENLIAELGEKGASIDQRVSITITAKDEEANNEFMTFERPDFVKEKKEGIWKVYPVVTNKDLTIELVNRSKVGDFDVDVLNEFGAVVFRKKVSLKRGKNKIVFELASINSGKYSLKIDKNEDGFWEHEFYKK